MSLYNYKFKTFFNIILYVTIYSIKLNLIRVNFDFNII